MFFISVCEQRCEINPLCGSLGFSCCVMWRNKRQCLVFGGGRGGRSFLSDCLAVRAQQLQGGATGIPVRIIHISTWQCSARWQAAGKRVPSRPPRQKLLDGGGANVVVCGGGGNPIVRLIIYLEKYIC